MAGGSITTKFVTMEHIKTCPACGQQLGFTPALNLDGWNRVNCENCGSHSYAPLALKFLEAVPPGERPRLAYAFKKTDSRTLIDPATAERLLSTAALPTPTERPDLLIAYLATTVGPGKAIAISRKNHRATLGCETPEAVQWLITQARELGYLVPPVGNPDECMLSVHGWQRYEELMRSGKESRVAFMAMAYSGDLWQLFADHLQPAVKQTGFELRTLAGDHQTAGSIDNRMRVEIRTSRFMVCDLTHGNNGAYWEAGFAEGLGRPVFYICKEDVLADPKHQHKPHFDINHQLIVKWRHENPAQGMQELKDVIRATLPTEAKMTDD